MLSTTSAVKVIESVLSVSMSVVLYGQEILCEDVADHISDEFEFGGGACTYFHLSW